MNLTTLLNELEQARKNATQGEWNAYDWPSFPRIDEYDSCVRIESETTVTAFCFSGQPNHDALFIKESANNILKLVEAARVMHSACKTGVGHEPLEHSLDPNPFSDALARVQEICKGGET